MNFGSQFCADFFGAGTLHPQELRNYLEISDLATTDHTSPPELDFLMKTFVINCRFSYLKSPPHEKFRHFLWTDDLATSNHPFPRIGPSHGELPTLRRLRYNRKVSVSFYVCGLGVSSALNSTKIEIYHRIKRI